MGVPTNTAEVEPMKLEKPLCDQTLKVVESPMVPPFINIPGGLCILLCLSSPPFGDPHLDFEFEHLKKKVVVLFPRKPSFCFHAASLRELSAVRRGWSRTIRREVEMVIRWNGV